MVGLPTWENPNWTIPLLESLGYIYWQQDPRSDHLFFVKGMPPHRIQRTHHIHVVEVHKEFWQRLLFRDYLRSHPSEARKYADLKHSLAKKFRLDREAYTNAKSNYIQTVTAKAKLAGF